MFGRFIENKGANILLSAAMGLACIVVMFHPNGNIAMVAAAFVLPATIIGVRRHRVIGASTVNDASIDATRKTPSFGRSILRRSFDMWITQMLIRYSLKRFAERLACSPICRFADVPGPRAKRPLCAFIVGNFNQIAVWIPKIHRHDGTSCAGSVNRTFEQIDAA